MEGLHKTSLLEKTLRHHDTKIWKCMKMVVGSKTLFSLVQYDGCPWMPMSSSIIPSPCAIPFKKPKQVTSKSFRHYEPFASDSSSRVDGRCSQADSHLFRVRKFSWMHVILKPLVLSPDSPIKPEQCGAHRYSVSSKFNHEFWKASLHQLPIGCYPARSMGWWFRSLKPPPIVL